ncbi:MAG: NAD-dependent epimerase/dehydratase family protein [Pedosphaera sp.]|nr:NAD-dependent epimerase/dehydratase family protein [Pedosphaera sp.]
MNGGQTFLADKPVLVTGGAGFIGAHLVERLLKDGHSVVVIDDLSTGSIDNLKAVDGHPRLRFFQSRISLCPQLDELMAGASYVFHLAAAVGVELVLKSSVHTITNNLNETQAVFAAALPHRTPVMLASTSEVYGRSPKATFSETDDLVIGSPQIGRWSYACSKLLDEFLALAHHREDALPITIVRLFNTVGPRQSGRYGMVLPRFIEAARSGLPLRVYGHGRQTRCFCHVADTVEALVRLKNSPEAVGEVFNVGNPEITSIAALARSVIELLGSQSTIEPVEYSEVFQSGFEDMQHRQPDISKLELVTGFQPQIPLREIIRRTAEFLPPPASLN